MVPGDLHHVVLRCKVSLICFDGTGNKINGNWSLAQFIYFTNPDFLSVNHTFEFLGLEDYIRIGGTGGSAVLPC